MSIHVEQFDESKDIKLTTGENTAVILEAKEQLSRSMLWKLQSDFLQIRDRKLGHAELYLNI